MQGIIVKEKGGEQMKQVFASYHYTSLDAKYNGFGNYVGQFDSDIYGSDDTARFILDLEENIAKALETELDLKVKVKVLFFR